MICNRHLLQRLDRVQWWQLARSTLRKPVALGLAGLAVFLQTRGCELVGGAASTEKLECGSTEWH